MTTARVLPVLGISLSLALLILAGCGRPTSITTGPTDITGEWAVATGNVNGDGMACNTTGLVVQLTQNADDTFNGSAVGGTLICTYMGTETAQDVTGLSVTGTVNVLARTIAISVPVDSASLNGVVNTTNTFMTGTAQLVIGVGGGGNVTVAGPWTANKVE
jgi:hypothetical protein